MRGEQYLKELYLKAQPRIKKHGSLILSVTAATGVVMTAVSAAKATPKAMELIDKAKEEKGAELTMTEKVITTAPVYFPAAVIGASTIACILGAHVLNKKQQAALTSAYALLNASYKEYREKTDEIFGEDASDQIKSAIAEDKYDEVKVIKTRPDSKEFEDTVLFFDEYRNEFFESSIEHVKDAEYHFNRNFALRDYAELNELYEFLGLPPTELGATLGWSSYAGQVTYGYQWVDFNHVKDVLDDGTEYYRLEMPFPPTADYMDY